MITLNCLHHASHLMNTLTFNTCQFLHWNYVLGTFNILVLLLLPWLQVFLPWSTDLIKPFRYSGQESSSIVTFKDRVMIILRKTIVFHFYRICWESWFAVLWISTYSYIGSLVIKVIIIKRPSSISVLFYSFWIYFTWNTLNCI